MKKKLNIIFITNNYKPYSAGVVSSIDSFVDELRTLGHQVSIITLDFDRQTTKNDPSYVIRIRTFWKFFYKQKHMAVPWMPYWQMMRIIKKINPDIIHVHHPFLLGHTGLRIAKKLSIPIIFTYHSQYENYTHYVPLVGDYKFFRKLVKHWATRFCNAVDHVIAPSETIKNYLKKDQVTTPISVVPSGILPVYINDLMPEKGLHNIHALGNIHNPIHSIPFHSTQDDRIQYPPVMVSEAEKSAKSNPSSPVKILTVTRFAKEKNIPFLIQVASELAKKIPIEYTFIGYGDELEKLKQCAYSQYKLSQNQIRFIIKPSKSVIKEYYRNSDLFLFGSQSETQGLVIAEAMAAGTPVVALKGPGIQDIIMDGKNGYLVKNSPQMVERTVQIITDKPLYAHLSKEAFHTGRDYTPLECTKKLLNVYTKPRKNPSR